MPALLSLVTGPGMTVAALALAFMVGSAGLASCVESYRQAGAASAELNRLAAIAQRNAKRAETVANATSSLQTATATAHTRIQQAEEEERTWHERLNRLPPLATTGVCEWECQIPWQLLDGS